MTRLDLTPADLGRLARSLPENAREALKRWASTEGLGTAACLGPTLCTRTGQLRGYCVGPTFRLENRAVNILLRLKLCERLPTLHLSLTLLGAAVARWLAPNPNP